MKADNKKLFLAVMDELESIEKACLLLTVVGEMSLGESARVLKRSKSGVRIIIARAKEKARGVKNG